MVLQTFDPDIAVELEHIIPSNIFATIPIIAEYATDSWPDSIYVMLAQHGELNEQYRTPLVEIVATLWTNEYMSPRDAWIVYDANRILDIIKNTPPDTTDPMPMVDWCRLPNPNAAPKTVELKFPDFTSTTDRPPVGKCPMYFRGDCPTLLRIQTRINEFNNELCHDTFFSQLTSSPQPVAFREYLDSPILAIVQPPDTLDPSYHTAGVEYVATMARLLATHAENPNALMTNPEAIADIGKLITLLQHIHRGNNAVRP